MNRSSPSLILGFLIFGLSQVLCFAEGLVVRAYRAELPNFGYRAVTDTRKLPEGKRDEVYEGAPVKAAPFPSRFIEEGDGLLDFTGWAKICGLLESEGAKAVFNERSGQLVVRAELRDHYFLRDYLKQFLEGQIRFELRLVKMPGAKFDFRTGLIGVMGLPTVVELGSFRGKSTLVGIWKVSQVLLDGTDLDDWMQAEKKGNFRILRKICVGGYRGRSVTMMMRRRFLEVESESQTSSDDDFVETRVTIKAKGKVVVSTQTESEVGVPVILQQEKVGKRWRSWVVTFLARYFADTIEEGL
ncbi:MAG: hypothetical protein ACJAVK_000344 [Akkermansiaceae bacterium]|jgi:hypothetical protein